jgi:uncharacterized protein with HEPN domain
MPSKAALYPLLDIRDNAQFAQQWTEGHTAESFREDRRIFYAVTRCLEIVSEASRRLPQSVSDRHPELPWRAIMDVGNVYRHAYDNVSENLVWRTVRERLPALLAAAEQEIAGLPEIEP